MKISLVRYVKKLSKIAVSSKFHENKRIRNNNPCISLRCSSSFSSFVYTENRCKVISFNFQSFGIHARELQWHIFQHERDIIICCCCDNCRMCSVTLVFAMLSVSSNSFEIIQFRHSKRCLWSKWRWVFYLTALQNNTKIWIDLIPYQRIHERWVLRTKISRDLSIDANVSTRF